jgi:citronellol/citronellal dehydrogenase
MTNLKDKTILITGASRGIGRAMALRFARDGANIVIAAKTARPHPKLPGTIHTVAEEVEAAGGQALPLAADVRFEDQIDAVVKEAASFFGSLDAVVNNAGAIVLQSVEDVDGKSFDLMHSINTRATLLVVRAALPHLKKADNPHVLNLSPPINLDPKWLAMHAPYTVTKYGVSLLTIGMAAEFAKSGVAVNSLWPRTIIATAAIEHAVGSRELLNVCRTPEIVADAAHALLTTEGCAVTGQCLLDEEILRERGVEDFDHYAYNPDFKDRLRNDLYVD